METTPRNDEILVWFLRFAQNFMTSPAGMQMDNNSNNNNTKTIFMMLLCTAQPDERVNSGPLSASRSAPCGF